MLQSVLTTRLRFSRSSAHRRAARNATARRARSRARTTSLGPLDLRKNALLDPELDKRLHGLGVLLAQQIVQAGDVDEVHEASVELAVAVQIPEREPVLPVQVCVAAEHLLVHVLDLGLEALREAGGLAEPVVGVGLGLRLCRNGRSRGERVHGEEGGVEDFAADPSLDMLDVGGCWQRHGVAVLVDPGVVVAGKLAGV